MLPDKIMRGGIKKHYLSKYYMGLDVSKGYLDNKFKGRNR